MFKEWFNTSRAVYNIGVDAINNDSTCAKFMYLRNKYVTEKRDGVKNENVQDWMLKTPKDIRADTLKELVSNFKGNVTKIKKGLIPFFNLGHKSKKSLSSTIPIPKSAIKKTDGSYKIYGRYIKDSIKSRNKKKDRLIKIENDCKLEWSYPNNFHLIIPYKKKNIIYEKKGDIVSLDPGVRKFMTYFSQEEIGEFHQPKEKLNKLKSQIDNIKSFHGNSCRRGVNKRYRKITNYITEFHYSVINYLTKNFKTILLPTFDSQEFFGKKRKIGKKTARDLNILSHYKFKNRLIHRCNLTTTKLYIVDESYTSKTCTRCGIINDVGSNEVYKCKECNISIDRDINGARNIYLKNTY